MLRAVLPFCRELGLERVLLTAGDETVGSVKTILKSGGELEGYVISPQAPYSARALPGRFDLSGGSGRIICRNERQGAKHSLP